MSKGSIDLGQLVSLATLGAMLLGAFVYLSEVHEPRGSAAAALGGTMQVLESQNQNIRNHYLGILEECADPDVECSAEKKQEARDQLKRLEWDRQFIKSLKQGKMPPTAD